MITKIFHYLVSNIYFKLKSNISTKGIVKTLGFPIIDIKKNNKLVIGKNVTLNSKNKGYHINLFAPVKLFADGANASIEIGDNTRIHGSCIHAKTSIKIGKNCLIAGNTHIIDNSGHDISYPDVENRINTHGSSAPVVIEDNVWICSNSMILPNVTIGNGSIIAANSVVTKDIPPMVLAGGNPAKVIKKLEDKGQVLNKVDSFCC